MSYLVELPPLRVTLFIDGPSVGTDKFKYIFKFFLKHLTDGDVSLSAATGQPIRFYVYHPLK